MRNIGVVAIHKRSLRSDFDAFGHRSDSQFDLLFGRLAGGQSDPFLLVLLETGSLRLQSVVTGGQKRKSIQPGSLVELSAKPVSELVRVTFAPLTALPDGSSDTAVQRSCECSRRLTVERLPLRT